jgi:hypothetical protein
VKQEYEADHCHHGKLFQQLVAQVFHCPLNQSGSVVDGNDFHPLGQAGLQALELGLDGGNGLQRVLTRAHHNHAACGFTFAIKFTNASTHLRPELDTRHVTQAD